MADDFRRMERRWPQSESDTHGFSTVWYAVDCLSGLSDDDALIIDYSFLTRGAKLEGDEGGAINYFHPVHHSTDGTSTCIPAWPQYCSLTSPASRHSRNLMSTLSPAFVLPLPSQVLRVAYVGTRSQSAAWGGDGGGSLSASSASQSIVTLCSRIQSP